MKPEYNNEYDEEVTDPTTNLPDSHFCPDEWETQDDAIASLFQDLLQTLTYDYFYDGLSVCDDELRSFEAFDWFINDTN